MGITERQEKILNTLIQEYIETAEPIGSVSLEKKYELGICPATIRNEMQKLTDFGYLEQPHTSAGRIPTNKAYRFFVDNLLKLGLKKDLFFGDFDKIEKETKDIFKFTEMVVKSLAEASSNLALIYLSERDFFWKDGWGEVFQNPEFKEIDFVEEFIKTVEVFEKNLKNFLGQEKNFSELQVFIGREKSILNSKDFSLLVSETVFPDKEQGLLALLGPKRMNYNKNINLINSLKKSFNEKSRSRKKY